MARGLKEQDQQVCGEKEKATNEMLQTRSLGRGGWRSRVSSSGIRTVVEDHFPKRNKVPAAVRHAKSAETTPGQLGVHDGLLQCI